MDRKIKIIISKDAMCTDYLPVYGNEYWKGKTPNMDELAAKGTVYTHYYTAAPSTVMSFFSMVTGKFAHETEYEMYEKKHYMYNETTIFKKALRNGFDECHIIWGTAWEPLKLYFDYFHDEVIMHNISNFSQGVGPHYNHSNLLQPDIDKEKATFEMIENEVRKVLDSNKSIFLWIHFPHVIYGRVAYGSDIDLFDRYIGMIRKYVPDDSIIITADHGNMNGRKGKLGYGYDVINGAIRIPLITPCQHNNSVCNLNVSSVDLSKVLFDEPIEGRKFLYSDTAYRAQKHRKLAIISGDFKYVYNKKTGKEELYDLKYDPNEEFSIMSDYLYDVDRKITMQSREEYFYPRWDEAISMREVFRKEKERIWRNGNTKAVIKSNVKDMIRPLYEVLTRERKK